MFRFSFLGLLVLFATPNISKADNTYILSWINEVLLAQGVYPFDPSPSQTLDLAVNNLQPTSLDDDKHYLYFAFAINCEDSLEAWNCTYCNALKPNVRYDSEVNNPLPNTKAFFAIDSVREEIILTFRGTYNAANAAGDFDSRLVRVSDTDASEIRVHAGFLRFTYSLYDRVISRLTNLTNTYPDYKVKIVGHSLGATEATLTTFLIKYNGLFTDTDFSLFSYGAPRVGNLAFATYFNQLNIPACRVVHRADLVPHWFGTYPQGYVHFSNEVCNYNTTYSRNCSTTVYEDPTCSNSQGPIYNFYDHTFYFDIDWFQCVADDPIEFLLQLIVNLNIFIPENLKQQLLVHQLSIPFRYWQILKPIWETLGK